MRITVFTPTYNRRALLTRAYESLKRQTSKDFEWLIVDDGSADDTKSLVDEWIMEGLIDIEYHYQENGGKMRAHNRGAEYAKSPLFLCLDSDDYLVDTAVEDLLKAWEDAVASSKDASKLAGIVSHKGKSETELLGDCDFPFGGESTLYGLYRSGFKGETTLVFRTEVIKAYPFPEIDGEKYVPEDYIYDKIDQIYCLYILPKIITVCEIVSEGYTDSVKALKNNNVCAWYLYYEQRAYITAPSLLKWKYASYYVIYSARAGKKRFAGARIPFLWILSGYIGAAILLLTGKE